ncbi:uncharacterized protein PHALS_10149 [Plasmopara halstedii]|uniref:Uncharacterized protein n=1 Tax=Plasmopara halstedii TaxID=4781 RepID=A0A0N7L4X9_PLAHL|nr:uncharacterized protein PHALS_10149 [Plasmopara halstedii]CEG39923.1 hypothetical protein PHALS_10149 [Plasmopara halstedii]|eukprot:XP_024576292.1 hypothetical protein PHALS_10149 [Plasmopara halstedii]
MLLGYAENAKWYRGYDLKSSKIKITRLVQLSEHDIERNLQPNLFGKQSVAHVFKEINEEATHFPAERTPVIDEPMNSVEKSTQDIKMDEVESERNINLERPLPLEDRIATRQELKEYRSPRIFGGSRLVYRPGTEQSTSSRGLPLLLEDGLEMDDE